MFDVGFSEMLLIAVVALVVLGPERLPKAARFAGLWVRKARAQWYSVKAEFESELAAEEFKRSVQAPLAELKQAVDDSGRELERDVEAARREIVATLPADIDAPATADPAAPEAESPSDDPAADAGPNARP
jgi:sec-independent protein translocase protein TatB